MIKIHEITEETVRILISCIRSTSIFTAFQAMKALSTIFISNHSLSHPTLQLFINAINQSIAFQPSFDENDFLIRQCFYNNERNSWICPLCLYNNVVYLDHCYCCNLPRHFSLVSNQQSSSTFSYNYLYNAYHKYLLICLLVISTNSEFVKELGKKEIKLAFDGMLRDDFLIIIGSKLMYEC